MEEKLKKLLEGPSFQEALSKTTSAVKLPRFWRSMEFRSLRTSFWQRSHHRRESWTKMHWTELQEASSSDGSRGFRGGRRGT